MKKEKTEKKEKPEKLENKQNMLEQLQLTEQGLQNLLLQKQVFQLEFNETNNALEEIKKVKGQVYKIVGSIMFSSAKEDVEKELERKKQILELRIKAIEKQEEGLKNQLTEVRDEVLKSLGKRQK